MRPSERHRFIAAVQRQEEQRAITEGARKGSLASLFPVSVLLYGDSAVSEVFSGDGTSARSEFRMGTVEYSQEIPQLDRIDPVGLLAPAHDVLDGQAARMNPIVREFFRGP